MHRDPSAKAAIDLRRRKIKFEAVLSTAQTLGLQIVEAFGTQVAQGRTSRATSEVNPVAEKMI